MDNGRTDSRTAGYC